MIANIIVGLLTGAISSLGVAIIFHLLARRDAATARLQAHLSSIEFALERCDVTQKFPGRRGDDGLEPTAHALGCMIRVLERDGRQRVADDIRPISDEMEALVTAFDQFDEAHKKQKKAEWQVRMHEITKRHS
jgi:hypothetical protein